MTFLDVLNTYGIIIFEFTLEFFVFLFLFLRKLERRGKFAWRVVLFSLAYLLAGLPVACFYTAFGATVWGRIIVYSVLFGGATLLAYFCFAESYLTVLFCCSMAYAAQNLVYKLFLIFWTFGNMLDMFENWGNNFNIFYRLLYYSIFIVCCVSVWFLFVRRITANATIK